MSMGVRTLGGCEGPEVGWIGVWDRRAWEVGKWDVWSWWWDEDEDEWVGMEDGLPASAARWCCCCERCGGGGEGAFEGAPVGECAT